MTTTITATERPPRQGRTVEDFKRTVKALKDLREAVLVLPIDRVVPWIGQPRRHFGEKDIKSLATTIDAVGQKTPIQVSIDPEKPDVYLIVDGERRYRARRMSNGKTIRAIVIPWEEAKDRFISSVVVNFNHKPHTRYETALAIKEIYDQGKSANEIAAMFGKSNCWVWQHLSLIKLDPEVVAMMDEDRPFESRLKFCIAILLTTLPKELQISIAKEITDKQMRSKAARHFVQVKAVEAGYTVGGIAARPEKRRGSLTSLVTLVGESLPAFLAAPDFSLREFLAGFPEADLANILSSAENSCRGWKTLCETAKDVLAEIQADKERRSRKDNTPKKRKLKKE